MPRLLDRIANHADLKGLSPEELGQLAVESGQELVATVTSTGGHLASNMGMV